MIGGRSTIGVAALALVLCAARAHAEPSAADKELARSLMNRGAEQYAAGDFAGARESFAAADRIMGVPTTALELGRAQIALGLLVEARETLARILARPVEPGEPEQFATARAEAHKLNAEAAEQLPTIRIVVAVAGARAFVDGTEIPAAAFAVGYRPNPGEHQVRITAPGHQPYETTVIVQPKEERTVTAQLVAAVSPPPPPAPVPVPGPEEATGGVSPLVYVGFGIGGACLLAGAVTGGLTIQKSSELEETCGGKVCTPEHEDDLAELERLANASNATLAIGAVGVVVGIVGVVLSLDEGGGAAALRFGPDAIEVHGSF
jgi:hypothetical protein